jgi:hypothetical protein
MFRGQLINQFVQLLESRGVSLFHACQLIDFLAYLRLGGIPSRAHLENHLQPFTQFDTDRADKISEVWDKVFVNFTDFGSVFAQGYDCVPNPYGPICLQFSPRSLLAAIDVAVAHRSAGAHRFNRQKEAIQTISDAEALFTYDASVGFPYSTYIKHGETIRALNPRATNPEISCTFEEGVLKSNDLIVVWVDPYCIDGQPLVEMVRCLLADFGVNVKVWERRCSPARRSLYESLMLAIAADHTLPLSSLLTKYAIDDELRTWAIRVCARGLEYQYRRYANYLHAGTIRPLVDGIDV